MRKLVLALSFAVMAFVASAQTERVDAPRNSCRCSSFWGLSQCEITCPPPGGAVCITVYGFCQCGCVGLSGNKESNSPAEVQGENIDRFLSYLRTYLPQRENSVRNVLTKYFDPQAKSNSIVDGNNYQALVNDYKKLIDSFSEAERALINDYFNEDH